MTGRCGGPGRACGMRGVGGLGRASGLRRAGGEAGQQAMQPVQLGSPAELKANPATAFVKELLR